MLTETELPCLCKYNSVLATIGGSCQKSHFCRDKTFVAFCRDKHVFVAGTRTHDLSITSPAL